MSQAKGTKEIQRFAIAPTLKKKKKVVNRTPYFQLTQADLPSQSGTGEMALLLDVYLFHALQLWEEFVFSPSGPNNGPLKL